MIPFRIYRGDIYGNERSVTYRQDGVIYSLTPEDRRYGRKFGWSEFNDQSKQLAYSLLMHVYDNNVVLVEKWHCDFAFYELATKGDMWRISTNDITNWMHSRVGATPRFRA
jgi:hypothetical protein